MSKKYTTETKYFNNDREAVDGMKKMIKGNFSKDSKPVMCECIKCGGIGFAQDKTMIDSDGFLIDMKCPCGGKIRKLIP